MVLSVLLPAACSGDQDTGDAQAGDEAAAAADTSITDHLKSNAEQFEYAIGESGGTLTLATISEPLTLNLALAKDAGSSRVLGYLFEGLTRTSWLTDDVEPELAERWERSEDGLTWTFHLRRDVTWHEYPPTPIAGTRSKTPWRAR